MASLRHSSLMSVIVGQFAYSNNCYKIEFIFKFNDRVRRSLDLFLLRKASSWGGTIHKSQMKCRNQLRDEGSRKKGMQQYSSAKTTALSDELICILC